MADIIPMKASAKGDQIAKEQFEMEDLKRRYDGLKSSTERSNCETHWQEIAELCSPRKLDFVGMRTPGEKKMNKVYDPTGILAVEMLAAGLHGMATNPASKWFSLRLVGGGFTEDPETGERMDVNDMPEVQHYLSDVEEIMWQRIYSPGTNFTTALHEIYLDMASFGTAVMFVGQQENGGLLFEPRPLSECLIAENVDGVVDTLFRCTTYTVRQMYQMQARQGWKVSDDVKEKYEAQKYDETVKVIHAIYPRADRDPSSKNTENMPYASCYFEHEACHKLQSGGFPEFPYQVARWSKYAGEVYGRSPGMIALPDVKMLQAMVLTKIKIMHKAADPPLWLRSDGVMGQTRTVPGGINYWRGRPSEDVMLQPVSLQGIQAIADDIGQLKEQILRTFYADLLRMNDRANMTATEVVERTNEMMRLFGPLVGRLESEMLGPLVARVFGILGREQLLPDPPEIIQDKEFVVEFVSPVATAQKQAEANQVMQALGIVLQLAGDEMGPKLIQSRIDLDKLIKWLWDLFNNDPDLLKDDAAVEQDNQMAQIQQGLNMAQPAVGMVKEGAEAAHALGQAGQAGVGAMGEAAGMAAQGGPDLGGMIQEFAGSMADNPEAQAQVAELMAQAGIDPGQSEEMV